MSISKRTRKLVGKWMFGSTNAYRLMLLRIRGVSFGSNLRIHGPVTVLNGRRITIGNDVSLNHGVILQARDNLTIGNHVTISSLARLHTSGLTLDQIPRTHTKGPIVIEDDVWIASGVVIGPGVTIGKNSIIGANSVVTKTVPSNAMYGGVPAKLIRRLPEA
jgi:acetyltransferase-like isoleucine patch superfamily enzyme